MGGPLELSSKRLLSREEGQLLQVKTNHTEKSTPFNQIVVLLGGFCNNQPATALRDLAIELKETHFPERRPQYSQQQQTLINIASLCDVEPKTQLNPNNVHINPSPLFNTHLQRETTCVEEALL
eukprot:3570641-Amphidinium_carterae.1